MKFHSTPLSGSYIIDLEPVSDERGWLARTFCKEEFKQINHGSDWVQMNHTFTRAQHSIRGMHFQLPPHSEIKLVRCIAGAVYDVIIDLRAKSKTFLQWFGVELSADNQKMLYIPAGFAHGFQTLTDNCELFYLHTSYYTPGAEGGIRFDDPKIGIRWKAQVTTISDRDKQHPYMDDTFTGINLEDELQVL